MPARPIRVKLKNELGICTTLPEGEQYLHLFGHGEDLLITCPGPSPALCAQALTASRRVFLLQVAEFDSQMPASWHAAIPPDWERVSMETARKLLPEVRVLHYAPASRLFPSIFAPLLAGGNPVPQAPVTQSIWLPGSDNGLIIPELAHAASTMDLTPRLFPAHLSARELSLALDQGRPELFLSVNFHGLDPYGENQAVLEAASVPLAVWCVDNPLHLLTGQKNQMWKRLPLHVTDEWFVQPLRALGADARHLPLAASPRFFGPGTPCPAGRDLTFVGRSSFPDRDRFFAACRIPDVLAREAQALGGRQAHFGWWRDRLPNLTLWPGNEVRILGLGAEMASAAWRQGCLAALSESVDLTIVGDEHWRSLVPKGNVLPPVDYYAGLAEVYRGASFSLNLTSLLLPHGLTQRHFDVWACGGFLLTDNTPGLKLFPAELTRPVTFETPRHAVELMHILADTSRRKEELRRAWQEHILEEHSYSARLRSILEPHRF